MTVRTAEITMHFFSDIEDELTGELATDFAEVFASVRRLTELLDLDSYAEMGKGDVSASVILQAEAKLSGLLSHELVEELPAEIPVPVVDAFLLSYRLEPLYPDTVGTVEETVSTIPLETYPHFVARKVDSARHLSAYAALAGKLGVTEDRLQAIESEVVASTRRLEKRRTLMDTVRRWLIEEEGVPRSGDEIKAVFDRYFPENPLRASEIGMIVTRTCLYWSLPRNEELEPDRTEEEKKLAEEWLKYTGRFAFQYFSHFPTFSSFDARDADPGLISELSESLGWDEPDVIEGLNSTTTIERTAEIEKYLIHDTWGHMWQGDLTDLRRLYDTMESLKSPVDANEHLRLPDGNILSPLDLLYLNAGGKIRFDEVCATRYADQWIRERMDALLAPIVAELTADCIEYKFKLDNADKEDLLPSSSLFSDNPAKLDFAWVDIGYFVRSLRRTNAVYRKNEDLKRNLVERICSLLKLKYPRQHARVESKEALSADVEKTVERFLELLNERESLHLNQELLIDDTDGDKVPDVNSFFLLFTNFLRVQFTLNRLIKGEMEGKRKDLAELFNVLMIFIARFFETDPMVRFWNLDETLGKYALALLVEASRAEKES